MIKLIGSALIAVAVNILLGSAIADFKGVFDRDTFILGVKKGLSALVAVAGFYAIGVLLPDMPFKLGAIETTMNEILSALGAVTVGVYATKGLVNLVKLLNLSAEDIEDQYKA